MKGSGLHWTLLLLSLVVAHSSSSPSPRPCDSRCVCYNDPSSNRRAANCSNVRYEGNSFTQLLKDVQILRLHDGNGHGGVFSRSWSSCPNLEEVFVSDNRQASLDAGTFKNCKKLRVLDVSHNKISKVYQINVLLKELPRLEKLVLKGNPIAALPDLASSSLTFLDLSYCSLNIVGHQTFAKLKKLHTLNLEGNALKKFKSQLPGSLRVLNLVLNDIATISPVEHFSKLRVLELAGNPLECSCELVRLRNQGTGDFVSSGREVTCAGPKSLRGLLWSQARKHCDQDHLKRRSRRDLDDLEEEGSGYDPDTDTNEGNGDVDDDEMDGDGDNLIEDDDQDPDEDADPIEAPAEEETESPDSEDTKLVDSKLSGTVEEPDENGQDNVGNSFFETDHSTSSTTEHEFIPHESSDDDDEAKKDESEPKIDADHAVTGNDKTGDTESEKPADNVEKEEEEDDGDIGEDAGAEVEADAEETQTESSLNYDITGSEIKNLNKENEKEEDGDNEDEDVTGSEDEIVRNENEKEEGRDNEEEDVSGSGDEIMNNGSDKEEDSDKGDDGVTGWEDEIANKGEDADVDSEVEADAEETQTESSLNYDITGSEIKNEKDEGGDIEEENITDSGDATVNNESEKEPGNDNEEEDITGSEGGSFNNESGKEGKEEDDDDDEEESDLNFGATDSEDENGKEEDTDNEEDYVTGSEDENVTAGAYDDNEDDSYDEDSIGPEEHVASKGVAAMVESEKESDSESKTEASLTVTGFEGSGSDSEDTDAVLPPVMVTHGGHVGHRGRKLEPEVRTGEDGKVSQGTTESGTEVSPQGTEVSPPGTEVPVVAPESESESEDTSETVSLESPESPVTSTGSYVVLGLIMVLIVFLLGYAVYKSRLGRRRSDSDSRTIKEKDVELGKGNDRELQDVSKPLLITPPAAAVNGKSELHQPLVSKPTENPQLKDDVEDKKKESPLPSRYHIYETLNGDKERIEVPPPTAAPAPEANGTTIPVTASPKKSQSPTRVVSKVPPPRDGPNMYGDGDDDDDGEVFLKNNQNQNGDLGSPRSCRVTVVQGDLSVPKKPVFVVNPGAPVSSGVV